MHGALLLLLVQLLMMIPNGALPASLPLGATRPFFGSSIVRSRITELKLSKKTGARSRTLSLSLSQKQKWSHMSVVVRTYLCRLRRPFLAAAAAAATP